ncbi:hypothetical protein BT96DRAFT_915388 [Gymnopus androsaceus JB14]|uniref:Uncharacterized protein n=1 Tax=Gymnopus androsaceus JB14 TaxID=1447944 RepID=A0A6A4I7B0_9AGAR|nr:hypothetical protein BT96DRAFT_915388 [Gymnopus androsaceus JB14]
MNTGGDDLDDGFVLEDDYVANSDEEVDGSLDEVEDSPQEDQAGPSVQPDDDASNAKKRKQREKNKERKAKRRKLIESSESDQSHSPAERPPHELSDYLCSMQTKSFPKMSVLELEDMRIPESSIADTTSWTGPRTLDYLADFIIKTVPKLHTRLSQKSKNTGSPTLLFVTSAALRVADVTRMLKDKRLRGDKGGERTKISAAVGTPGRIGKLLCETDALTISACTHIVLDISWKDSKKRNLLDIPETRDEVFRSILGAPKVLEAIKAGKIQIVLF